ncbi:uncharacterized protein LOC114313433 [Camellia sinensis]|uniref:uncharacterized protein LOC114313433 n=1 Tax=Camellia sinensis TaxID=4442 RepID=UPI001035F159|nr:uncharacterized protein LOC114313433 [Camellia sinensis]
MAAEMETLKHQIKEKGVVGVGNHSECSPPRRSDSHRRDGTPSFSITRSFVVGDSDPPVERSHTHDCSYRPLRPWTTSRYSYSAHLGDLRDVLEERARCRETQRLPAMQRLSPQTRCSEEVAMLVPRIMAPAPMGRELARFTATPLSPEIESMPLPTGFHQPKFTVYDGKMDQYMRMNNYSQVMAPHRRNGALMCLIFTASLGELGLKWFERLLEESIEGQQQLAEGFVTRFKTNIQTPKEVDHLLSVKMESGGSFKAYNAKYWETYNDILDCPTILAIAKYKRGLPVGYRLEEEDAKRKLKSRTGTTTIFKIPIYRILNETQGEPYVRWLAKLGDTQRGFNSRYGCTFHEERGYRTEDCVPLKRHLEELVAAGYLDQYIDRAMRTAPQGQVEPNGLAVLDAAPRGVINVIHGIIELAQVCELRGIIKKAEHMREVLSVQPSMKKGKTEVKDLLTFSKKDLERIQTPHNDALVVTLRIKDFNTKRILID